MSYQIVENDVRLIRRMLVCFNCKEYGVAKKLHDYLEHKGINMILPKEQGNELRDRYYRKMNPRDMTLAIEYGMIILPDYKDAIFLNSEWRNPRTLYVRLVDPIPELGIHGDLVWSPDPEHIPTHEAVNAIYAEMREKRMRKPSLLEKIKARFRRG